MNAPTWSRSIGARVALAAFVAGIAVTGWTIARALRAEPLPDVAPGALASLESIKRGPITPPTDIEAALDNDLFSPDRTAPAAPYRMPGEQSDDRPAPEPMKPIVLGTVVATDGRSFATMQLGNDRPTLVHVGDKIGDWLVKTIARGKVTLVSTGGSRVDVTVPKPGT